MRNRTRLMILLLGVALTIAYELAMQQTQHKQSVPRKVPSFNTLGSQT